MKNNRSLFSLIIFSILTCGVYALFFWHKYSQDVNIVCQGDGRHTRGILARIVFSVVTFGIYNLVWMYGVGERIAENSYKRDIYCRTNGGNVVLWYTLGALILIGPLIALHKLISGLNALCYEYNNARNA